MYVRKMGLRILNCHEHFAVEPLSGRVKNIRKYIFITRDASPRVRSC